MTEHIAAESLYAKLRTSASPVALALTFRNDLDQRLLETHALAWTREGAQMWHDLAQALGTAQQPRRLPHRAFGTLLDVLVPGINRQRWGASFNVMRRGQPVNPPDLEFVWLDAVTPDTTRAVQRAVRQWLLDDVHRLVGDNPNAQTALERVQECFNAGRLLEVRPVQCYPLPWSSAPNGTTKPLDGFGYPVLADAIARALEGQMMVEKPSPLRRLVSRHAFNNHAELITDPIAVEGQEEPFSLAVRVMVASLPSIAQPLVLIDFSKRRWVQRLKENPFGRGALNGFAFPVERHIAVQFRLEMRAGALIPGEEYASLVRQYSLRPDASALAIAQGQANSNLCTLVVNLRHGFGWHTADAGVPEHDKIEAFERIARVLEPFGLCPWNEITPIKTSNKSSDVSGLIDARALKRRIAALDGRELHDELGGRVPSDKEADAVRIVDANRAGLKRYHPQEPLLVIAYYPTCYTDAYTADKITRALTEGAIRVTVAKIPDGTHGPRGSLPGAEIRDAGDRAQKRFEAWSPFVKELRTASAAHNIIGCLVIAPDWYDAKPDDPVNKPATRKAIAGGTGIPVQYLLPQVGNDEKDFYIRTQYAWRDLVWAHQGVRDGIQHIVQRHFASATAPREVISISIIQKNRARNGFEGSLVPVAIKLEVESDHCLARFAFDNTGKLEVTDWEPLACMLARVARLSPLSLGESKLRRERFELFCQRIITQACAAGMYPLVMIHANNARRFWRWLRDTDINPSNIDFDTAGTAYQVLWHNARIVRIRTEEAPQIILDKTVELVALTPTEAQTISSREFRARTPDKRLRLPTSPNPGLYRVYSSLPTYFSIGKKRLHKHKRGLSCYRSTTVLDKPIPGEVRAVRLYPIKTTTPINKQWPTPNAVEFVIARMLDGDQPDDIARFLEALRSGFAHYDEWTSLPAPLFFERVIEDYIAQFENADEENAEDDANQ